MVRQLYRLLSLRGARSAQVKVTFGALEPRHVRSQRFVTRAIALEVLRPAAPERKRVATAARKRELGSRGEVLRRDLHRIGAGELFHAIHLGVVATPRNAPRAPRHSPLVARGTVDTVSFSKPFLAVSSRRFI